MNSKNLKALSYGFYELVRRPVKPTRVSLWSNLQREEKQTHSVLGKNSRWALCPRPSCSYQVGGGLHIH